MNAIDSWLVQTAANLAKEPEHADDCHSQYANGSCTCGFHPSTLQQRIAIGVLQSRALECRELVDHMRRTGMTLKSQIMGQFAEALILRSRMYEQKALQLCDQWPPSEEAILETCDCGHTISQHSQKDGIHGPCSACGCKGYSRKTAEVVN